MTLKNLPIPSVSRLEHASSGLHSKPPVISAWAQRVLYSLENPQTTVESFAELIAPDNSLSRFLRLMAVSATNGSGAGGQSLIEAVSILGFKQIQALVLSAAAASFLTRQLDGYRQNKGQLWEHSISTAANARWISQVISYPAAEEAYAAGLIHDIGKPLLDPLLQPKYHQLVESLWKRKLSLWQAEQSLFKTDHAEVGSVLALQWRFPPSLTETIRCHHLPGYARIQPELAAIVHVANAFAPQFTLGLSSLGSRSIHPAAMRILKLDIPQLESMRSRIWEEQHKNISFYIVPPVLE